MKHTSTVVQTRIREDAYRIARREGAKRDLTAGRFINMLLCHREALQAALSMIDGSESVDMTAFDSIMAGVVDREAARKLKEQRKR